MIHLRIYPTKMTSKKLGESVWEIVYEPQPSAVMLIRKVPVGRLVHEEHPTVIHACPYQRHHSTPFFRKKVLVDGAEHDKVERADPRRQAVRIRGAEKLDVRETPHGKNLPSEFNAARVQFDAHNLGLG